MRCDDCAPEFGCWDGSRPCQKNPPAWFADAMRECSNPPVFAFPQPDTYHPNGQVQLGAPGMTLRDYFAIRFAVAILSNTPAPSPAYVARASHEFADAMLAAREEAKP